MLVKASLGIKLMTFRGNYQKAPITLLWHDYETGGLDKARDRPLQFASIRTDLDLNIISDSQTTIFCKISEDAVPSPAACVLTGISPQRCNQEGVSEAEFAKKVEAELGRPGTCGVGYNTIRFDDEFTRHLLYRCMRDPYEREWANGNSRWDLVDVVRTVYALRPSVMNWPTGPDGKVSFKLEDLADANNLPKTRAHDALSDVETTIALARLVKAKAPEIFDVAFALRLKKNVMDLVNWTEQTPLFHVSSLYGTDRGCVAPLIPLAQHPSQANVFIGFDLMADPAPLLALSPEEIADRIFRAEKGQRLPVTTLYANRAPMLFPAARLRDVRAERVGIGFDKELAAKHWKFLRDHAQAIAAKVQAVYAQDDKKWVHDDPELCLYSGFASNADRDRLNRLRTATPATLAQASGTFDNKNYDELLFRYRARNWPETLDAQEAARWSSLVHERLTTGGALQGRTLAQFEQELQSLRADPAHADNPMLLELAQWHAQRSAALVEPPRASNPAP